MKNMTQPASFYTYFKGKCEEMDRFDKVTKSEPDMVKYNSDTILKRLIIYSGKTKQSNAINNS